MKVLIISSASTEIDPYYCSIARSISNYLARNGCDLVFGASSTSMMGVCYDEFIKQGREVYAFTTEKYQDDLKNLDDAYHYINETTFDMKKGMFETSDLIVVLPGGIGTISELLSYVEENRSNDKDIPIEIYDENGYFKPLIETLKSMKSKGFISSDLNNLFTISHNKEEFIYDVDKHIYGKRREK